MAQSDPGIIVITSGPQVADVSFDPSNSRLESAGEGAASAARAVLNTPALGNPQLEAGVGVLGFVLAPFAAAYGAIGASQQRLSPEKVSEAESDLGEAMRANAGPETLLEKLGEAARQRTHRLLVCGDPAAAARACRGPVPVSAVLEVTAEQLRLEAVSAGGKEYALTVQVRARLVNAADGLVLLNKSYRYHSGSALFIDWARHGGLESVAQTAYGTLAEQIAADVFQPASQPPILIGPGQKHARASSRPADNWRSLWFRGRGEGWLTGPFMFRLVSSHDGEASIEVYTRGAGGPLIVQKPGPESAESPDTGTDTEWSFDGLVSDRNSVVQAVSCLAAVPMGIWEQTVGAVRKGSLNRTEQVAEALNALVGRGQFERDLGDEVARHLRSQAGEGVTRTEEPTNFGLPGVSEAGGKASPQPDRGASDKTALELQVLSTRLVGKHRNSGSRALAVEIQATLIRTSDGQELYSCPIRYRGKSRKLKNWTEADAKLLREELNACSQATAQTLAGELIRRGLVVPKLKSGPVVPEHL